MKKTDITKLTAQQLVYLFLTDDSASGIGSLSNNDYEDLAALRSKYFSDSGTDTTSTTDWNSVKDRLHAFIDNAADPVYANVLGEIYCYGRCNDGHPDHEKAFYYFMMGAAGGVYESKYKLSDLLMHGNGAAKNKEFAKSIISEVYTSTLEEFLKGDYSGQFADAAIRMGHITKYSDDIDFEKNIFAYKYYLQAKYALELRQSKCGYSDEAFAARLNTSLCTLSSDYPEVFNKKTADYASLSNILNGSFSKDRRLQLKIKKIEAAYYELRFSLLHDGYHENEKLFITIPETNFCGLKKEIKIMFTPNKKTKHFKEDTCIFNSTDNNTLYFFGKEVLKLDGKFTVKL